jgi:hypothetical protein
MQKQVLQIQQILLRLSFYCTFLSVAYREKFLGTSHCDGWDMPIATQQPLRELPTLAILFLHELPKACGGPFPTALAVPVMVVQPLAYRSRHSMICQ